MIMLRLLKVHVSDTTSPPSEEAAHADGAHADMTPADEKKIKELHSLMDIEVGTF